MNAEQHEANRVFLNTIRQIKTLREDADTKLRELLQSRGWKYTSSTPGFRWMFEKEIDGKIVLTHAETALLHEEAVINSEIYDPEVL